MVHGASPFHDFKPFFSLFGFAFFFWLFFCIFPGKKEKKQKKKKSKKKGNPKSKGKGPPILWLHQSKPGFPEERTPAERDAPNPKWQKHDQELRARYRVAQGFKPWTSQPDFKGRGLSKTSRNLSILDATVIRLLGGQQNVKKSHLKEKVKGKYVDVSQALNRNTCTNEAGISRTQTTSTVLYSFERDRVLVGKEMLMLQGQKQQFKIPQGVQDSVVKELAGEGMSVPCVGMMLWCLFWVRFFP